MTLASPLHDYLNADLISVRSDISSRKKLLQEMASLLSQPLLKQANAVQPDDTDSTEEQFSEKDIYHCLLEREKLGNTGVGNGVALPHSRCQHTSNAIIAIIILEDPIDYDSIDGQGVDVAFGLLVPQEATQEHLNLLASIARLMSNNEYKAQLAKAHSAQQVINYIQEWSSA